MTLAFFDNWSDLFRYNTLIVLIGVSLLSACSGLVGTFAVLRRRSLTGDALAHAALPGVCLGFLILQERSLPLMLLGALVTGVLGTQVISALRRYTRIKEDAAIGIVLSVFFAIGIVLKTYIMQSPSLGGSRAGLDSYILGKTAGMIASDVYLIASSSLFCLLILLLVYKELKLIAFDSGFAQAQGWPVLRLDLLLMGLLAVTVVTGLSTVGAVMIAALLIIPAASYRFWTERLSTMLLIAGGFGFATGVIGTMISASQARLPAGPIIVLVGTILFLFSVMFSPNRGFLARLLARVRFQKELQDRALMELLFDLSEPSLPECPVIESSEMTEKSGWQSRFLEKLLRRAARRDLIQQEGQGYRLTSRGLHVSAAVARDQRLWELFLNENAEQAGSMVNLAKPPESVLPVDMVQELCDRLEQQGRLPEVSA